MNRPAVLLRIDDERLRLRVKTLLEPEFQMDDEAWSPDGPRIVVADFDPVRLTGQSLVWLGDASPERADAVLSAACSDDELRMACRMAAEISRLRQRLAGKQSSQRHFQRLAFTDPLSGLPNRRAWDEHLARQFDPTAFDPGAPHPNSPDPNTPDPNSPDPISRAPERANICLAIIDLDEFKRVNDRYGHEVGDRLIERVSVGLRDQVRTGDLVARLGGDEFGLLLHAVTREQAQKAVERIRSAVGIATADWDGPAATASAGFIMAGGGDAKRLYQAADAALLRAKADGRNCTREATRYP